MGANHGSLRQSGCVRLSDHNDAEEGSMNPSESLMELLKPDCLKIEKPQQQKKKQLHQQQEKKISKLRIPTLEERLLSSPGFKQEWLSGSGVQIYRQSSKICPLGSISSYARISYTPRESFSMDGGVELGDQGSDVEGLVSCLTKNQSGRKKRVSFRLPEEADIHMFYIHDDSEEEGGL